MKSYQKTAPMSCVRDAFEAAGLPTYNLESNGIPEIVVVQLLEFFGYKVYLQGEMVSIGDVDSFFITWQRPGIKTSHIEYHIGTDIFEYVPPEWIVFIAKKD